MFSRAGLIALTLIILNIAYTNAKNDPHLQGNNLEEQLSSPKVSRKLTISSKRNELLTNNLEDEEEFNSQPISGHQWDKDGNLINSNQINLDSDKNIPIVNEEFNSNNNNKQQDYVCGKAQLNNKIYKNSEQFNSFNPSRTKYRPTEIRMPRIIGGDMASPGEFPWTASIKLNEQPICGGSLIDKSWILTAAHCVVGYNPKNLTVRLGAHRIRDLSETHSLDTPISMFIVHKDYSMPRPFSNDIALVKLRQPIEYSDYIIPICLPTEDQLIISSNSNSLNNDFSNLQNSKPQIENQIDQGGIVISTKMSDHDIAKCFSKLEQNYLNSIGLGTISSAVAGAVATATPETISDSQTNNKNRYSYENQPIIQTQPTTTASQPQSSQFKQLNQFNHQAETNDISYFSNDIDKNDKKITYITQQFRQQQQQQQQQQQREQNLNAFYKPLAHHQTELEFNNNNPINSFGTDNNNPPTTDYGVYYGIPWARRFNGVYNAASYSDNNKIKLSRLPISKELLKEIQSVGSGSMAGLNLGFNQGDLVNMANELTIASNGNPLNSASPQLSSIKPIPSTSTTSPEDNSSRGILTSFLNKVIRTSTDDEDAEDDPTKYSGLSGLVVGWGWVRELDEEDNNNNNNKGYSSITLQKVKLPILRNNVCEVWFQSQSKKITLLPSQFCAGFNAGGKDACRGDSGGPMIIEDNSNTGRYKLIGIVSAGIGCARRSLPGLYTRVASFIPWINSQMLRYGDQHLT